jgi:hypothetical protein
MLGLLTLVLLLIFLMGYDFTQGNYFDSFLSVLRKDSTSFMTPGFAISFTSIGSIEGNSLKLPGHSCPLLYYI